MKLAAQTASLFRSSRALSLVGLGLVLLTLFGAGIAVWDLRSDAIEEYQRDMRSVGVVLAEQTSRSVQGIDLVVQEVLQRIEQTALESPDRVAESVDSEGFHLFLADRLKRLPQADALVVIDAEGRLAASSRFRPVPSLDLSQAEQFRYFREHDDPGAFISAPIFARVTGTQLIFVARRIDGPEHRFLGVVQAAVDTRYFARLYESIALQDGAAVSLVRRDGAFLARYPASNEVIGRKMPAGSTWQTVVQAGGGIFRSLGNFSGVPKIIGAFPVVDLPLVVGIAQLEAAALAPWRQQTAIIGTGAFLLSLGFAALFRLLAVHFRRLEESEASLAEQNAEQRRSRAELEARTAELTCAAEALRESEERFRDFARTSSDWFWEQDAEGRFTWILNFSEVFAPREQVIGKTRRELGGEGLSPEEWAAHEADLAAHRPFRDLRYSVRLPRGELQHVSVSGTPIFDKQGTFRGYRGTGRDITAQVEGDQALRQAKEEAEEASRTKSQFLANMSHELRTPLNAILGFSEMIRDGLLGPIEARYREYARDIHGAGQHLLGLINDILDLSKIEVGRLLLHEEEVEIAEVVAASCHLISERARNGNVEIETRLPESLPALMADPLRLKQIVLNVLSNAVKFTPPGGKVTIAAALGEAGALALAITDTGVGMKPQDIPVALTPFRQVEDAFNRSHEGTGLGLPLAKMLTERHGGSLDIESRFGVGTTVRIRFPAERVLPQAAEPLLAAR